jgi:phospholipase/carboxylesterase
MVVSRSKRIIEMDLPLRHGERPRTTDTNPHQQLTQNPTPEVHELLLSRAFDLPHVERRPSAISVPGAQALWLSEEVGNGPADAFLIGREFAHIHPPYDGSLHAMLPSAAVDELLAKGWGELHPMARRGVIPATAVMIYAPRSAEEVETVLQVIEASARFAFGERG